MKIYLFTTFCWASEDENIAQNIFPVHRPIYFSKLLKEKLLSDTTIPQAQPAFICLNSAILTVEKKCEICSKLTKETTDVVLVFLLLTLNRFDMLLWCVFC